MKLTLPFIIENERWILDGESKYVQDFRAYNDTIYFTEMVHQKNYSHCQVEYTVEGICRTITQTSQKPTCQVAPEKIIQSITSS